MSKRSLAILMLIIGFGLGVGAGMLGLLWATGNLNPSTDVANVVPTLSLNGPTSTPGVINALSTEIADLNDKVDGLSGQVDTLAQGNQMIQTQIAQGVSVIQSQALATEPPPSTTEEAIAPTDAPANDTNAGDTSAGTDTSNTALPERQLYRISADESEVSFHINEVLMGSPKEVIATTSSVAGDVIVNFSDPVASQVGEIAINARTLKTDNDFRNQSIRGQILSTSNPDNEFIRFVATEIQNMPAGPVSVGDTIEFDIVGDLTVKGTTKSVSFHTSVTVDSAEKISGSASSEILYKDFGINIQAPPSVSGIEDNVILMIDFVANVVNE